MKERKDRPRACAVQTQGEERGHCGAIVVKLLGTFQRTKDLCKKHSSIRLDEDSHPNCPGSPSLACTANSGRDEEDSCRKEGLGGRLVSSPPN